MRRLVTIGLLAAIFLVGLQALAHAGTQTIPYDPGTLPATGSTAGPGVAGNSAVGGASANLPYTGSDDTSVYVGIGIALLLGGAALVIATARRRSAITIDD